MALQYENELFNQLDEPKLYKVYMLNDDYTSWEFCLRIISRVFHKSIEEANIITQEIHTKGRGLCGVYPFEIAETKASQVHLAARKEGFPMKCHIEEEN